MQARLVGIGLAFMLTVSVAWGKKQIDPKDYVEGKMVKVKQERLPVGTLSAMQGASGSDLRFTYIIESKDGRYEAREFHNGTLLFRPVDVEAGGTVMFRVHPKGRL